MEKVLKPFGRYFLLDRIAQGGMAEIFRARMASSGDSARLVAIKALLPHLATESRFIEMFSAEVRITLALNHPNIIHHYDFGDGHDSKLGGIARPFIAMEYLPGRSLRQIIRQAESAGIRIPIALILHIVDQIARALHYAHEFRDPLTDQYLNIVHRDVSPPNILVSYEGAVKMIDFGIAKAASVGELTESGLIKGTPAYLSPEQVKGGAPLDRRSDLFTLGTVTWELLTGGRLFAAEDNRAVLMKIDNASQSVTSIRQHNPEVPVEVEKVVLKALASAREARYPSLEVFRIELKRAGESVPDQRTDTEAVSTLAALMQRLFHAEMKEEMRTLRTLNDAAVLAMVAAEAEANERTETGVTSEPVSSGSIDQSPHAIEMEASDESLEMEPGESRPDLDEDDSTQYADEYDEEGEHTTSPDVALATQEVRRGSAREHMRPDFGRTGETSAPRGAGARWLKVLVVGAVIAFGVWVWTNQGSKTKNKVVAPAGAVPITEAESGDILDSYIPVAAGKVALMISVRPPGPLTTIMVGEKFVIPNIPFAVAEVGPVATINLMVRRPGYVVSNTEVSVANLAKDASGRPVVEVKLTPDRYGLLTLRTDVSAEATIKFEGESWTHSMPIEAERFKPGNYEIRLESPTLGLKRELKIRIEEGKSIQREENLSGKL